MINEAQGKNRYKMESKGCEGKQARFVKKKKRGAKRHMKDEEENRSSAACADSRKIYFCERMNGE